jgi:hypothetical protein
LPFFKRLDISILAPPFFNLEAQMATSILAASTAAALPATTTATAAGGAAPQPATSSPIPAYVQTLLSKLPDFYTYRPTYEIDAPAERSSYAVVSMNGVNDVPEFLAGRRAPLFKLNTLTEEVNLDTLLSDNLRRAAFASMLTEFNSRMDKGIAKATKAIKETEDETIKKQYQTAITDLTGRKAKMGEIVEQRQRSEEETFSSWLSNSVGTYPSQVDVRGFLETLNKVKLWKVKTTVVACLLPRQEKSGSDFAPAIQRAAYMQERMWLSGFLDGGAAGGYFMALADGNTARAEKDWVTILTTSPDLQGKSWRVEDDVYATAGKAAKRTAPFFCFSITGNFVPKENTTKSCTKAVGTGVGTEGAAVNVKTVAMKREGLIHLAPFRAEMVIIRPIIVDANTTAVEVTQELDRLRAQSVSLTLSDYGL